MTGFRRYPDYRDPGVEWLGEIPAHWEIVELGSVGAFSKGRGGTKLDEKGSGVPCVRYGDLYTYHDHHIVDTRSYLDERVAEAYTPITYGDVLFAASGETLDEIGKSAANLIQSAAVCGGDVIVFRADGNPDPRFLGYSLGAAHALHQKTVMGRGFTVVHIYIPQLRRLGTPLPPLPEQRAIADFLDRQISRIDRLVRKKERLIELLNEKRASMISHAVTRGLDPDAPMRDSGVEWLGEIPAHWKVVRLKALSDMKSGESITAASVETSGPYPVYGGNGLRGYTGDFTHEGEHLLIGRQGALCGNVHLVQGRFWASEHAVVVSLCRSGDVRWLGAILLAMDLNQHSVAAAQPGLAIDRIRELLIPLPSLPEQRAIADFLHRQTSSIDVLVSKTSDAIEQLREYRASVISAAVTGRTDVRDPWPPP